MKSSPVAAIIATVAMAAGLAEHVSTSAVPPNGRLAADTPGGEGPADALDALLDEVLGATSNIPALIVHLDAPRRGIDLSAAAGVVDTATGELIAPNAGVRIASNTKTFTAAAILRLIEDGLVDLDDPLTEHLPAELTDPLVRDGYRPDDITIAHLLLHTSGLYDYASDDAFRAAVLAEPTRHWTRLDQIRLATEHGDPQGEPGASYNSSTLRTMLATPSTNEESAAGMGILRVDLAGQECWFHDGFWGTVAATCPDADITIALSFNQARPNDDFDGQTMLRDLFAIAGAA